MCNFFVTIDTRSQNGVKSINFIHKGNFRISVGSKNPLRVLRGGKAHHVFADMPEIK